MFCKFERNFSVSLNERKYSLKVKRNFFQKFNFKSQR